MNFAIFSGVIKSINDGQSHSISAEHTKECFKDALNKVKVDKIVCANLHTPKADLIDSVFLSPRNDGNYSMVDELFTHFTPTEKWASVAITGKDGKPFYIKNKKLVNEIIMRCESSIGDVQGNNVLLNTIINKISQKPKHMENESHDEWSKRYNEWSEFWKIKPSCMDIHIFDVFLFSCCYCQGCQSFVHPKTGKVGLITNCRWVHNSIADCREELEWICKEICTEENGLEFYVSFFNEEYGYMYKWSKDMLDPQFTFKLSYKGIELVNRIPVRKMKYVFKCNRKLRGKEWKRNNFLWGIKNALRKLQKKFFYEKFVEWHNYKLLGGGLNSISHLFERYYTVDEIIKMMYMWRDELYKNKE